MYEKEFHFNEKYNQYEAKLNGLQFKIPQQFMSVEMAAFAKDVAQQYTDKLYSIAQFCVQDEAFQLFYPDATVRDVMDKLHAPIIRLDAEGGILTYTEHELDEDHLIDVEFEGGFESFFSVNVDG